jgi:hypothetical protein
MDNQQAKLILTAYRPHGQDADDPFFAEALQQAGNDPTLAAWFREQQDFDAAIATALAEVHGPVDAKSMIKATMGASARPSRYRGRWLLAAGLTVLLGLSVVLLQWTRRAPVLPEPFPVSLAARLMDHNHPLAFSNGDLMQIRAWLTGRGAPVPGELPPGLAGMNVMGCESWETEHGKVSLICFFLQGEEMHLCIFEDAAAFPGLPALGQPQLEQSGKWALALWQDQGRAYVLGVPAGGNLVLEHLLHG